jgi:hypothetical protein
MAAHQPRWGPCVTSGCGNWLNRASTEGPRCRRTHAKAGGGKGVQFRRQRNDATHADKREREKPLPGRKRVPPCKRWAQLSAL